MIVASAGAGRNGPRLVGAAVGVLALAALVGAALRAGQPPSPKARGSTLVVVKPGSGVTAVADLLARRGLVRSAPYFVLLSLVTGSASHLEAGTYRLSPAMAPATILRRLSLGEVATAEVTVVPGMTVAEVAMAVQRSGLMSAAAFLRYAASARPPVGFAAAKAVRQPLEGYLYPDTYRIALGSSAAQVVVPMLSAFLRAFGANAAAAARAEGLTPAQAVTLASIVQREASTPDVRRQIAGVFMNRLRAGMPLGSDATVYYAADVPPGRALTAADLASKSAYNTLNHAGMPPGPIDSPGSGALAAALHPAKVPYLYFFARLDGRFVFSRTYAEQVAAEARAAG